MEVVVAAVASVVALAGAEAGAVGGEGRGDGGGEVGRRVVARRVVREGLLGPVAALPAEDVALAPEAVLGVEDELLLGADDGARAADAHPAHALGGRVAPVLHHVGADVRARAAEAGLAVDGDRAGLLLADLDEALHDLLAGVRPVLVPELDVADARLGELALVVELLVEADDAGDAQALEEGHVVLGGEGVDPRGDLAAPREGRAEGQELARDDPGAVAVLQPLHAVVLVDVELLVVEVAQGLRLEDAP